MGKKEKIIGIIGIILFLYLFILSVVIIKEASLEIGKSMINTITSKLSPINAFGAGWFITIIMQSSGAATSTFNALYAAGAISSIVLIFLVIGTRIGTTITALFISLFVHAKRRDFRHGFEIGLANLVYAFPIAIILILFEYFFHIFSNLNFSTINIDFSHSFNIVNMITSLPISILSHLPNFLLFIIGIVIIIVSLNKIPKYMMLIWGEENLRNKLNKYLGKKYHAFFIGFIITAVLLSTSITITLLIPIIVSRLINLKKAIPYMIGSNLGTVVYPIISSLALGKAAFLGIFVYSSFSIIGLLWLFNIPLLFSITKYVSKRTLHVSQNRALIFVILFVIISLILAVI